MRAAPLGLAFLLAFSVPLVVAPEADAIGGPRCVFVADDLWVCLMEWDEPPMYCAEYRIIGRHEERCVREPPILP